MSGRKLPIASVEGENIVHVADTQLGIPPHRADFGTVGPVTVYHADGIHVGTIEADDSAPRIAVSIGKAGCALAGCTCGQPGIAFLVTPTASDARDIAASLIREADAMEASAKADADALIARARSGGSRP